MGEARTVRVGGPWFDELTIGQVFDDAPAVTITSGHAAMHLALFGDRLRLPLDVTLCEAVTGRSEPLAHPNLVCNVVIGQTTHASQRVMGNLFYRGLVLLRPVFVGDTLRTRTTVVGLKQNRARPGKPASGLVALHVQAENQDGEAVLDFWRCPMLPLRDPGTETGHADDFSSIPAELDLERLAGAVPAGWRLDEFRSRTGRGRLSSLERLEAGTTFVVEGRDTVTAAPELVRLTLNMAAVHTDAAVSGYRKRLVYGGHTISMAGAQVVRALPDLVTIVGWRGCDHTGPVFEGDVLRTEVTVETTHPLDDGAGLVDLRATVYAGGDADDERPVLDWRLVALVA
jgi:2-methylfumaryl-CoA hydratase